MDITLTSISYDGAQEILAALYSRSEVLRKDAAECRERYPEIAERLKRNRLEMLKSHAKVARAMADYIAGLTEHLI